MNVVFLFDADGDKYDGNYYYAARELIFQTDIIQASGRHMKMSVGDVLWRRGGQDEDQLRATLAAVYLLPDASFIHEERLESTFGRSEVFAAVFENMTEAIALKLHEALSPDERYLGFKEAVLEFGPHLVVYRVYLSTVYRLQGRYCRSFYSMSSEDSKDQCALDEMGRLGFDDLGWEDSGARKTIFDDFDTLEHFTQVAAFRDAIAPHLNGGIDDAFELVMLLEDLNPRLFNALGAAVKALAEATNEEHVAQAALSGRRYMEALTDALYPARTELVSGRKVGKAEYRNRLWAFIEAHVPAGDARLVVLGKEADRLVEELNGGLHSDHPKERMMTALADASAFTATLLSLAPDEARKPYLAFGKRMIDFFKEGARRREDTES